MYRSLVCDINLLLRNDLDVFLWAQVVGAVDIARIASRIEEVAALLHDLSCRHELRNCAIAHSTDLRWEGAVFDDLQLVGECQYICPKLVIQTLLWFAL
jgi:hypothetical protein